MGRGKCKTDSGELAGLCISLGRVMYKQADQFLSAYGLTPSQFEILALLSEEGAIPLSRVSEHLGCACSNVTGLVDNLEREGLVQRQRSEQDRRVILLGLTQKGQKIWRTVPHNGCGAIPLDRLLDKKEESEFRRILEKLLAALA